MLIPESESILRLIVITLLSGLVGLEREYHLKPAGIRTNIMVGVGATLMTIASVKAVDAIGAVEGASIDPTRIAAQIITGIGFIGAGAILRREDSDKVIGLTTAASLWVVTGLGIAVGLGLFTEAVTATLIVLFTFSVLSRLVDRVRAVSEEHSSETKRMPR